MARKFYFDRLCETDNEMRIFRTDHGDVLQISSFKNGIAIAVPRADCTITTFAPMIADCFSEDSNFTSELLKAFDCSAETTFTGIQFKLNSITLLVTKENADKDEICAAWHTCMEANAEKRHTQMEKPLKPQTLRQIVILSIDETVELEFKDEKAKENWEKRIRINTVCDINPNSLIYARRWAKCMQYLMSNYNMTIPQIADRTSHVSNLSDVPTFAYIDYAVSILKQYWKYGEELSEWYNQHGQ